MNFGLNSSKSQRCKEPPVLASGVPFLQCLAYSLLRLLALLNLLKRVVADSPLKSFQLHGVSCGHQVVVIDDFDEGLDAGAHLNALGAHTAGDLLRVTFDAINMSVLRFWAGTIWNRIVGMDIVLYVPCYDGMGEGMRFCAGVLRLDYDDLSRLRVSPCFFLPSPPIAVAFPCVIMCFRLFLVF